MREFGFLILIVGLCSLTALAADSDALPANALAGMHVKHAHPSPSNFKKQGNIPTPHGFPLGVDTIVNFTDHFESQGVYFDGSAHHIWEYSMVGNPPAKGGTTWFHAPVVPVSMDLRNADGSPRYVKVVGGATVTCVNPPGGGAPAGCTRLFSDVSPFIAPFLNSPVFQNSTYSSSPVPTQFVDAVQKSEFGNRARPDWHTLLAPSVKATRTMVLLRGTYQFALNADGTCCAFVLVLDPVFGSELFPPTAPDNSTVIGSAEVAGDITTKDISTFLFPNVFLFESDGSCCVLGFHSFDFENGDASNGNRLRFYIVNYSSWTSPGLFDDPATCAPFNCFEDVTPHSHEVSETFNDPFVGFDGIHNITPFWLNPAGQCQDLMEDGDVIEDLPNPTVPITIGGFTYHPQTEALLPWFEFQQNSSALHNAYSYPNETALTSLSAPQALDCK